MTIRITLDLLEQWTVVKHMTMLTAKKTGTIGSKGSNQSIRGSKFALESTYNLLLGVSTKGTRRVGHIARTVHADGILQKVGRKTLWAEGFRQCILAGNTIRCRIQMREEERANRWVKGV